MSADDQLACLCWAKPVTFLLGSQAAEIPLAVMTWRNWHHNFYHAFGEDLFHVYNLACKYLHICEGINRTDVTPLFIERYGDYHPPW